MAYVRLYDLFPDVAMEETRTLTVFSYNKYGVPPGNYGLIEMYCNDEGCDCRRVFLAVISSVTKSIEAVITFGWESKAFYARWMNRGTGTSYSKMDAFDREIGDNMHGIHLNLASEQSKIAPNIMQMVTELVLSDKDYVDRLKRHYKLFRSKIDEQYGSNS
jgi:hypothetical protein